jgi:hypothetical protein
MSAFLKLDKQLPEFDKIIENPMDINIPEDMAGQLMLMFQATDRLKTQDELSSFMKFVKRIDSSEIQAIFFTMIIRSDKTRKLARSNLEITKWASENHELF